MKRDWPRDLVDAMIYNRYEAKKVAQALARAMNLTADSMCFCGCGKFFGDCCGGDSPYMSLFLENVFAAAVAYRDSQGGTMSSVPMGIWRKIEEKALRRLGCVYPGCTAMAINSHLIPETILRTNFGSPCKAVSMVDGTMIPQFVRVGVGRAGCLPVFCSHHDNAIFRDIDRLEADLCSEEQLFRFAYKAIAFSLRRSQYLLGVDSQIEIIRPFLLTVRNPVPGRHTQIDISAFHEKYVRFILNHGFLTESTKAMRNACGVLCPTSTGASLA